MTLRDYLASVVRTVVPMAAGVVLAWAGEKTGIVVPSDSVEPILAAAAASGYYALVRLAEQRWPVVGWLLGFAVKPTYEKAE